MLAIEVNFLTGRFVATAHHDRRRAEWPPHPARFFSALVATWADADDPDLSERRALEWMEAQSPPSIHASKAVPRGVIARLDPVVSHFVPVNDAAVISRSSYLTRYKRITALKEEMTQLDPADPAQSRKLNRLETKVRIQQGVSALVAHTVSANPNTAMELFPENRIKQERHFPSVTPVESRVTYIWDVEPPGDIESDLDGLLSRVTRLGHSSSLVTCRLQSEPPPASHVPGDGGTVLRTVRSGQLAALERVFERHKASRPRSLPFVPTRYRTTPPAHGTESCLRPATAGETLMFQFSPNARRLPPTRSAELAAVLRSTVFHYARDPLPEGITGHRRDGSPSTQPHVGFLALPWVGSSNSDGRLMGMAIGIPHSLDRHSRRTLLRAVGRWEARAQESGRPLSLTLGRAGRLELERVVGVSELVTLRPWVWTKEAREWVSVTPIALPAHPGRLGKGTAAARAKAWRRAELSVVDACRHVGLREVSTVTVSLDPFIAGVRPAQSFPAFIQGGNRGKPVARRLVHAFVTFEQPVEGPLALGAGRYLGLGLMRPAQRESRHGTDDPG